MANWRTKINIRQYINASEQTPESVLECAKNIKKEIDTNFYARRVFSNLPHQLINKTQKAVDAGFDYESVCDVFNGALSKIYDVADRELVWTYG